MMSSTFLEERDLIELTGRCWKSKQIEWLRKAGITFWVNAAGKPVVPSAAIEGRKEVKPAKQWTMPD